MKIEEQIKQIIVDAFAKNNLVLDSEVEVTGSKDKSHGDFASNVCLKNAKKFNMKPFELGKLIADSINDPAIDKVEMVMPGFLNFFVNNTALNSVIAKVLEEKDNYGTLPAKNITLNIEYVSANPTGDLHLGHARGAAIGDSISRIMKKAGYNVIREFYVNDAGAQMMNLAKSLKVRYLELFDIKHEIPADGYAGQDVVDIAKTLKDEFGDKYLTEEDTYLPFFKEYGMDKELLKLRNDLQEFRVEFDVYSFETKVRANNAVENLIASLGDNVYEEEGATYLRTSKYLDDKDRVIIKSNGDYTYFLPDIVYHLDKKSRSADFLIDVLGADHHGYINRMKSALMMNGYNEDVLSVELIQMVRLMKDGEEIKMSKRSGNAIKMRDLVSLVGIDACRYFFVARAASSHLDFDLGIAMSQSSSNPVYYAQYAHARICSVLKASTIIKNDKYELLTEEVECSLMKCLSEYDKIIDSAASERAPYRICNYVQKLAGFVHEFYTKCRVLDEKNPELTGARLSLIEACSIVLRNALSLIGVHAPEKM